MYGFELAKALSYFKDFYKKLTGIYSIDQLPAEIEENQFVIVNLSRSDEK